MDGNESELMNISKHDLVFSDTWILDVGFESESLLNDTLVELDKGFEKRNELEKLNPNILILSEIYYREGIIGEHLMSDSNLWIRDNGIAPAWGEDLNADGKVSLDEIETGLIDFTKREVQEAVSNRAKALADSKLFDGIMLDWWSETSATTGNLDWSKSYLTLDEEVDARVDILKLIRNNVPEDFLILVNSNSDITPKSAPYINGLYMECYKKEYAAGYELEEIHKIESTLLWAEKNLRQPTINCLEGWRVVSKLDQSENRSIKERNTEENLRWMRLFTTMSLTLSDGYVLFSDDNALPLADHGHNNYEFWQLNIGKPIEKHVEIELHLYKRKFDNGYVIYNGTNKDVEIIIEDTIIQVSALDGMIILDE
jgi:hypothetical protein